MPEAVHKTREVFGVVRDVPLNYVEREAVDHRFLDSLTRDKHVVIYGSSKQGKTSLRKHALRDTEYIAVHCSSRWTLRDLHAAILKGSGYELTVESSVATSGNKKVRAELAIRTPSLDASIAGAADRGNKNEVRRKSLELELDDVNDIILALHEISFDKFIVLEDFHYLPTEIQRDFAVALKAFHENSRLCFIIVGVWLEENRLTVYNGDLTGRLDAINADQWREDELRDVIDAGAALLNVAFDPAFVEKLVQASQGSVSIVQQACGAACDLAGVRETTDEHAVVGQNVDVDELVKRVVDQSTGRYNSFLMQFADGFQSTTLHMYRWILYPVIMASANDLEAGLRLRDISHVLHEHHPSRDGLNIGNITQALKSTSNLQASKSIKPIVLDYDHTNRRLRVVDRAFLIWRNFQDANDLLELVGLPPVPGDVEPG